MEWIGRTFRAVRWRTGAAAQAVRRAWAGPGRERDMVAQACKAALAAWVAWAVAGWWLAAPMAFVAPWVAVALVESTVYRSVAHGLQQLAAIAVGTVVATATAMLLGDAMVTMALVLPVVLLLGQWRRLGSQGVFGATGALFVLTSGPVTLSGAAARLSEAVFGAVVGVAVNALVRPPTYLRDTRAALAEAADEARDILDAVADGLTDAAWDGHEAGRWHERALRLGRLVDQARSAIGWSEESLRGNLLRSRRSGAAPHGTTYDDALAVLDHVAVHTAGVTRTVREVAESTTAEPAAGVTGAYADFLRDTARAVHLYGRYRFAAHGPDERAVTALDEAAADLRRTLDTLRQQLPGAAPDDPDALVTYGTLLAQAQRLADHLGVKRV
ncbi:aromatic acid exporter family protein [Streptomyces sp. NPDC051913]|uniref:aromatic acid exporter family protein n=1 Tax=Streptomyces sp. NPDC051913 TaxID=3365676 RepID=UPI0037D87791